MRIYKNDREGMTDFESLSPSWIAWSIAVGHKAYSNHRTKLRAWEILRAHKDEISKELQEAAALRALINTLEHEISGGRLPLDEWTKNKMIENKRTAEKKLSKSIKDLPPP